MLLFSVVDFSVVVLLESGALLLVSVVVVDWDDFSDASGAAGAAGAPVAPCGPGAPAGPWVVVSFTVSLHPTATAPEVPSSNVIATYVAALLIFLCMASSYQDHSSDIHSVSRSLFPT